jgi:hypothetical protein
MDKKTERRGHERCAFDLVVILTGPDGTEVRGTSRDVSLGGVFLRGGRGLSPDADCRVELATGDGPEAVRVVLQGRVARADADGIAVEYTWIDADNHARLHELLTADAAPSP